MASARTAKLPRQSRAQPAVLKEEPAEKSTVSLALLAERNRLAQTLHDTLCQNLTGIYLQAALVQRKLEAEHVPAMTELLELKQAIKRASRELQSLVRSLRQPDSA